jgi:thiosulfate/3-mercaptopyruvate sulfurtransferase
MSVPVVVYDCADGKWANRASFMIQSFGHANVRILDGGMSKWKADGGEVHSTAIIASADDYNYDLTPGLVFSFDEVK